MEDTSGDSNPCKEPSVEPHTVKTDEKKEPSSDNIFQHFHDKYLQLKTDPLSSPNSEEKLKLLLESMIDELNSEIKKIDSKHNNFLRFLSMKIFLHYVISKFLEDSEMIVLLEKAFNEVKPYICETQVVYSAFLVINSLSTVKQKTEDLLLLNKTKEILEECQTVYKTLKSTNKEDNYYSGKELFSPEKEMLSNKEAKIKYEKLALTNLLLLGSVYEKLDDHYKDIVCYHTAFKRMLNKGLVNPYKWVDFTTRLACVFIDDDNFKDARHHLAAATHVHEILEEKHSSTADSAKKELIRCNSIHLALAWVRYCVLLFEKSKDEDRKKFAILFKNGYLCPYNRPCQERSTVISEEEEYDYNILNDNSITLKNHRFIESIDKDINDDYDNFNEIINENCVAFGDFLDEIMQRHPKENNDNKFKKGEIEVDTKKCDEQKPDIIEENSFLKDTLNLVEKIEEPFAINETKEDSAGNHVAQENNEEETKNKEESTKKEYIENIEDEKPEKKEKSDKEIVDDDEEETSENILTFSSLGYLPIEHIVPKDIIQSPEEAKNLFKFGYNWSKRAQSHYPKSTDFYSYTHVILNMVSLYRLCAYFQGRDNLEYRINLEQTRENLLEHLVSELSEVQPESHLHVRLYQEMALLNVDLAMLNMCNIYNISSDDTYKLCALAEVQSHINHVYIVGDMLQKSTKIFDKTKESVGSTPPQSITSDSTLTNVDENL